MLAHPLPPPALTTHSFPPPALRLPIGDKKPALRGVSSSEGGGGGVGCGKLQNKEAGGGLEEGNLQWHGVT